MKKRIGIMITCLIGIGIMYIYFFKHLKITIPCVFHKFTGLYCPGCGITRCFNALLHLEFYQAFRYNPLVFILLPFSIIYIIIYFSYRIKNKKFVLPNWIWYGLLIITIIFGILRNILPWLAPTYITTNI